MNRKEMQLFTISAALAMTDNKTADFHQLHIDLLKRRRSQLQKLIPQIRHSVSKRQASKKRKWIDYTIGRMVFFSEDFQTAAAVARQKRKAGEL